MNPVVQILQSLITTSTLSVRLARAGALAGGAIMYALQNNQEVPWSAVGAFFLAGFLGAGEPNK